MGGQREVRGGSGRAPGGRKKNFHLVKFEIMGLCGGFSLLLERPELMLNELFDDIFSESPFFQVFSGVIYTKISGIVFR